MWFDISVEFQNMVVVVVVVNKNKNKNKNKNNNKNKIKKIKIYKKEKINKLKKKIIISKNTIFIYMIKNTANFRRT